MLTRGPSFYSSILPVSIEYGTQAACLDIELDSSSFEANPITTADLSPIPHASDRPLPALPIDSPFQISPARPHLLHSGLPLSRLGPVLPAHLRHAQPAARGQGSEEAGHAAGGVSVCSRLPPG
jgi:hypothetical protein